MGGSATTFALGHRVREGLSPTVYAELVAKLHETRPATIIASLLGAGFTIGVVAFYAHDPVLGLINIAVCASLGLIAILLLASSPERIRSNVRTARAAEKRFAALAVLPSGFIGLAGARTLIWSPDAVAHLLVFSVAMAAMISTMRNHTRPRIVVLQLAALSIPIAPAMVYRGSAYTLLAGGSLILIYLTAMTTRSLYLGVRENLQKDEHIGQQKIRFEAALNNMAQGLCMFDPEGRVVVANRRYIDMYRFSEDAVKPGTSLQSLLEHSIAVGNHLGGSPGDLTNWFRQKFASRAAGTFHNVLDDGRTIAVSYEPMANGGWVTTHEDITDRKAAEARIAYLARHDPLTHLANRVVFKEALEAALARVGRGDEVAVLCVDLDRFKSVNDTLGHPVGDELLRQVSERLKAAVRETDLVARLGGDEFAIIEIGSPQPTSATTLAERVIALLSAPFEISGHVVSIGCSIGISIAPEDGSEADQLLRNADLALYRAKAEGRGQHRFFSSEMDDRMQARRRLELDLRGALASGQFELVYQPLVTVGTGAIAGFEALLRWNHPKRGLVMPDEFISLAEEIGLIVPIGDWVLRDACATAAKWPEAIRVAVNLSPVQFRRGDIVKSVANALCSSGLDPQRLELEITEGVLLANSADTIDKLHRLRALGVRVAMDDFGTGYSSLSYLRSFPFDKIKIDRSFIKDIDADAEAMAIVKAVADLGKSLGMSTTAEGIETSEQFERLREDGCTEVQGYLFGRPMSASDVVPLITRNAGESKAA